MNMIIKRNLMASIKKNDEIDIYDPFMVDLDKMAAFFDREH